MIDMLFFLFIKVGIKSVMINVNRGGNCISVTHFY